MVILVKCSLIFWKEAIGQTSGEDSKTVQNCDVILTFQSQVSGVEEQANFFFQATF